MVAVAEGAGRGAPRGSHRTEKPLHLRTVEMTIIPEAGKGAEA